MWPQEQKVSKLAGKQQTVVLDEIQEGLDRRGGCCIYQVRM